MIFWYLAWFLFLLYACTELTSIRVRVRFLRRFLLFDARFHRHLFALIKNLLVETAERVKKRKKCHRYYSLAAIVRLGQENAYLPVFPLFSLLYPAFFS